MAARMAAPMPKTARVRRGTARILTEQAMLRAASIAHLTEPDDLHPRADSRCRPARRQRGAITSSKDRGRPGGLRDAGADADHLPGDPQLRGAAVPGRAAIDGPHR